MTREKSTDVRDRMGIYKTIDAVPDLYRLDNLAASYNGRDVWDEFCEQHEYDQGSHALYREEVDRAGRLWKEHVEERGSHHALAMPEDVETWLQKLRDTPMGVHRGRDYWTRLDRFYEWLMWHTDFPHRYNPVRMAVVEGGLAAEVWADKMERHVERREAKREVSQ